MRLLFSIIASIILAGSALAAPDTNATDKRLDQKVTYQAKGELLHKVLADLTKETGVTMRCGSNQSNWQVRDRKVTVFVKEMPLRDVQANLAKLLHFKWTTFDSNGVTNYRLIQDAKARAEEEALRVGAEKEKTEKRAKAVTKAIEELESIGTMTPADISKLKETNPWLHMLATQPVGKTLSELIKQVPEVRAALAESKVATIPLSSLSPESRAAAEAYARATYQFMTRVIPRSEHEGEGAEEHQMPSEDEIARSARTIEVNETLSYSSGYDREMDFLLGEVTVGDAIGLPLIDGTSPIGQFVSKQVTEIMEGGRTVTEEEDRRLSEEVERTMEAESSSWFTKLPEDDPSLAEQIKWTAPEGPQRELAGHLQTLAEKSELQIFCDYFRPEQRMCNIPAEEKLSKIIEKIAVAYGKQPTKTGNTLVMEDHIWFEKRSWEISESQLEGWKALAKEYKIRLPEIAEMASLTNNQIDCTLLRDEDLRRYHGNLYDKTDDVPLLRFYATLSKDQQSAANGDGLPLQALTETQLAALQKLAKLDESKPLAFKVETEDMGDSLYCFLMVVDTSVPREPHSSITEEDYEEESAIETDEPASDVTVEEDCTDGTSADEESSEEYEAEMDDYEMEAEDSHEPGVIEEWMYSIPTKAPDYHEEGEEGHEPDPSGNMPEDAGETGEG